MTVIEIESIYKDKIKNVVAYVRISTLQEKQMDSFENQKEYYETYIRSIPTWNYAGIYADEGLSGRSTKNRIEFNRMINDAVEGKIDIIIVKSISRFSRNIIDVQKYLQLLRIHNVEVIFDKERLSSFNRNAELILNTLALCAEQESKAISDNIKWTYQRLGKQGIRHLGSNKVLGYDEIDGVLVANERAETIRFIYTSYDQGLSIGEIIEKLYEQGERTLYGKDKFSHAAIKYILRNEIYVGDRIIQKNAPKDFYTKKPGREKYDSIYIKDDHEPIISRNIWERVQRILS